MTCRLHVRWAWEMRAFRLSNPDRQFIFSASKPVSAPAMRSDNCDACAWVAASNAFASAEVRAWNSPFNFSSRAAKSWRAPFSASSSASISLTPSLLTIFVPQKLNENRPVRERVCECKSCVRNMRTSMARFLATIWNNSRNCPTILCQYPGPRYYATRANNLDHPCPFDHLKAPEANQNTAQTKAALQNETAKKIWRRFCSWRAALIRAL